jgi:alanyl-tRNA synthetase
MEKLVKDATAARGGRWVVAEVRSEAGTDAVREAADRLRGQLGRGAAVLALRSGGKLTFLAAVTDDLVKEKKLSAADLVKQVAQVTGGSGGGKPHLALAGGKDAAKLEAALKEARRLLAQALA